eukprot:6480481-Alexandrium_andersonii.AAC.1
MGHLLPMGHAGCQAAGARSAPLPLQLSAGPSHLRQRHRVAKAGLAQRPRVGTGSPTTSALSPKRATPEHWQPCH